VSLGDGSPPVTSGAAWFMGGAPVGGLGDEVPPKLKLFCETTHNYASAILL